MRGPRARRLGPPPKLPRGRLMALVIAFLMLAAVVALCRHLAAGGAVMFEVMTGPPPPPVDAMRHIYDAGH